jgi:hypothetical protein
MNDNEYEYPVDPFGWVEFYIYNLEIDLMECCYLMQQVKCLLKGDLND